MSRMIFVNHAVADLSRSRTFFSRLGFTFNPAFSDERVACMVINEQACVMLLSKPFFDGFHHKQTADSALVTETLLCLSAESREDVDALCIEAFEAGATEANEKSDEGFMYGWSFQDLDGHLWEVLWMDPAAVPA